MQGREKQKDNKIIPYRKKKHLTFFAILFTFFLIYLVIQGVLAFSEKGIRAFNVGAETVDSVYGSRDGVILRNECCYAATSTGVLNCYAVDSERVSLNQLICTIDAKGNLEEKLKNLYHNQAILTGGSRTQIQNAIKNAAFRYDPLHFNTAKEAKVNVKATVFENLIKDGSEKLRKIHGKGCTLMKAEQTGFVSFSQDGYENVTVEDLKNEDFNAADYRRTHHENGDWIKEQEFAYKLVTDNKFQLVFPLKEEEIPNYSKKKNLTIRFSEDLRLTGAFEVATISDGTAVGVVTFKKYNTNFLEERYVTFQILDSTVTGFKIPESAITYKNFYVVDKDFITEGSTEETGAKGVYVDNGKGGSFVPCTVYNYDPMSIHNIVENPDQAYVFSENLKPGQTVISMGKHKKTGTIGVNTRIEGVYQINRGYCMFKPIVRLANSLETSYCMIASDLSMSVQAYDRIVQEADSVSENEIIFK